MHFIFDLPDTGELGLGQAIEATTAEELSLIYPGSRFIILDGPLPAGDMPASADFEAGTFTVEAPSIPDPTLDRRQFNWLLAKTGLDAVWDEVEKFAATYDRELYADLRFEAANREFHLDVTLAFIAEIEPLISSLVPDADLSPETIVGFWYEAAGKLGRRGK